MSRILVLADIHGNLDDLLYLTGWSDETDSLYPSFMRERFDTVLLLGDYIGDNPRYCSVADGDAVCGFIERKLSTFEDAVIIKGNHEQGEIDSGVRIHRTYAGFLKGLSAIKFYEYHGIKLFCRHEFGKHLSDTEVCTMAEKDPDVSQAAIVCFGHDHKARVFAGGKRVFMNPGPLMKRDGERPCYGIIDTNERVCELKRIDIEGCFSTISSLNIDN
jgi:predicted phosphodiesterase